MTSMERQVCFYWLCQVRPAPIERRLHFSSQCAPACGHMQACLTTTSYPLDVRAACNEHATATFEPAGLGLAGEFMGGILRSLRSARSRLTDHFLSEYGFSLLVVLGAQFSGKSLVGGGEGVIRMLKNDTIRSILESGGFVLEEVLQEAGSVLKVCTAGMSYMTLQRLLRCP